MTIFKSTNNADTAQGESGQGVYLSHTCYAQGCTFLACSNDTVCKYHRDMPAGSFNSITRLIQSAKFGDLITKIANIRKYYAREGVVEPQTENTAFIQLQCLAREAGIPEKVYTYQTKGALHERILGCRNRWSDEREDISVYMTRLEQELIKLMRKSAGLDSDNGMSFDPVAYLRDR